MSEEKQQNLDEVAGFGAINWDIICRANRLANRGEEIELKAIHESPGGSAANTISWMSQHINKPSYIGAIGDDSRGKLIIEKMESNGIDTKHILKKRNYSTGTAISILDKENERTLYTYGGAGSSLGKKEIQRKVFEKFDLIHTSSFLSKELLEIQKEISKLNNVFSFAPGLLCKKHELSDLKPILVNTDLLFINKSELMDLTKKQDVREGMKKLKNIGVSEISATLGSNGSISYDGTQFAKTPAEDVDVIDTTGAGDAYCAGYLLGYIKKLELSDRAQKGTDMAKRCVKKFGGGNYGHSP